MNLRRHDSGKAGSFISNLYGALDQGEEGDIVSRSIVCCRSGNPVGETQESWVGGKVGELSMY